MPVLFLLSRMLGCIPLFGRVCQRLVTVANYYVLLPLTERQQKEWLLLDVFDWLLPQYDSPQTAVTVRLWMETAGMKEVEVMKAGHLVVRGKK